MGKAEIEWHDPVFAELAKAENIQKAIQTEAKKICLAANADAMAHAAELSTDEEHQITELKKEPFKFGMKVLRYTAFGYVQAATFYGDRAQQVRKSLTRCIH